MGIFSTAIEIGRPDGSLFETIDALVDTGSRMTAFPGSLLRRLGVIPHTAYAFELADGREIERAVGRTWIRIGDRSEITPVMFNDEDTAPLLGSISLHGLMLTVDSANARLIPAPRLRLGRG